MKDELNIDMGSIADMMLALKPRQKGYNMTPTNLDESFELWEEISREEKKKKRNDIINDILND